MCHVSVPAPRRNRGALGEEVMHAPSPQVGERAGGGEGHNQH